MSFHFPSVFPLTSDRSVWHNGKHPRLKRGSNPGPRDLRGVERRFIFQAFFAIALISHVIVFYYINTNKIPSERENVLSSHVKRSLLLWLHIKIAPFDAFCEMIQYFIGVYIIKRILHGRLEKQNFSSRVEKYFTRSLRSLAKYSSTLEEKFRISARPCNISSVSSIGMLRTNGTFNFHNVLNC